MTRVNRAIIIRPDRERKDGTYPLNLRISIRGKTKYIPLGYSVLLKHWDDQKQKVKSGDLKAWEKNMAITNIQAKAATIERYFLKHDKVPTVYDFCNMILSTGGNPENLFDFIDYLIKDRSSTLAKTTLDFYEKNKKKLQNFRKDVSFGDIDIRFIQEYKNHLIELGNSEIYVNKCLEFLRRVLNSALKEDRIPKNPFVHFKLKDVKGKIEPLTVDELKILEATYQSKSLPRHLQNVLRYFLFCCYTGLRYGDVKRLRFNNVVESNDSHWIVFDQEKTDKHHAGVPLIRQALYLMPDKTFDYAKIFDVKSNQVTGRHLQTILKKVEFTHKKITFHSSRHTLSNLLYVMGVPIELRAKIIGDTETVTKDRYTKIQAEMIKNAMDAFSKDLASSK